jgi:hypothetical protein
MIDQQQAAAARVHPHPIRWDAEAQLWVCTQGCGFTRPKREGEVVPSREEARLEAQRAGTGADFADLPGRTRRGGPEPGADGAPSADGAPGAQAGEEGGGAPAGTQGEPDTAP